MNHVNLHGHTTFSTGDGNESPEDHVAAVAALGQPAVAFTEHGNVSSHAPAERAGVKHGIDVIKGYEAYCDTGGDNQQLKHHLTVLASTQAGLSGLYTLVTESWENFKYKPTTKGEMLANNQEGLIVLSGCLGSRLATAMLGGKGEPEKTRADLRAGRDVAAQFREVFGDRYYLEVQAHPKLARQKAYNEGLARISKTMGIPLVVTGDVHYTTEAGKPLYPLLHSIVRGGKNNTLESQSQSWEYDIGLHYMPSEQVYEGLLDTGLGVVQSRMALEATLEIAERCKGVKMEKFQDLRFPGEVPSARLIKRWVKKGWRYRGLHKLHGEERRVYLDRLKYELELILLKGFEDYFLVIAEMTQWAKDNGIPVGPARGSAAASLVCWLLRITEVNPMLFPNLIFERFIDINRHDLPDIDLDFDDELRWMVRAHLVEQYGAERVGNIGTFTMYRGKNSLEKAAKAHMIPISVVEEVKAGLIERSSGDLRADATIEDSVEMFPKLAKLFDRHPGLWDATKLEGNIFGFSVHAAGLVVANGPLRKALAVYTRDIKDPETGEAARGTVCSIDKYDAEYLNVLKIDALGLTTMGLIRRALNMIGMSLEELYKIPLDDPKVFEGFRRNEVIGIFQFDGRAMRSVNREVKPDNFAEVCDINALARPGPLHSGAAAEYIMAKHGKRKVVKLHPVVTDITAHTQGQIVYQEQILRVVRELGGFTWEEAALVRKLISKKQGEQAFNRLQGKFLEGCKEKGVAEAVAVKVWKQLVTAGAYAFNAAHCVSYGMLAYWTMWLKQNHPLAFYCAALQKYKDKEKILDILKEASFRGVQILPPDPSLSQESWSIEGSALRAGLTQVKGIGEANAAVMLEYREQWMQEAAIDGSPEEFTWDHYQAVKGIGPAKMDMVRSFAARKDPFGINTMRETLNRVREWLWQNGQEHGLPEPTHKSDDVPYEPGPRTEYVWVGYVRNRNLKDIYELHRSRTGEELDPKTVKEPEHVNYVVITGEDETGPLVITVHRWRGFYEKNKEAIWDMDPSKDLLLVIGTKRNEYRRAIYATELHVLSFGE
jgi:DNA polymerase III subunit alpha